MNIGQHTISLEELLRAIAAGELDQHQTTIREAFKGREAAQDQIRLISIRPGDTVRFNAKCRPAYMIGLEATVVKVNQTSVTCDLKTPVGRFGTGKGIKCPISLVEKI